MTERTITATAGVPTPGFPARADTRHAVSALFVDLGEYRGERWVRPPHARFECLLCRTAEGPVHGADAVTAFNAGIRTAHQRRCTALQENHS
ncbi:hypothetical protein HY68_12520 [Streptomyces sp. AcH 505]|uniref:hypothetical protein n=1 Tax=Streptomyces sp. AcH 505 TaxID=352211 RepID=UPI000591E644|nr:hypothetical protein HY68_12520 [Streptomyces sp. AcH 505]